ncbi:hypothetical protein OYT13_23615 [Pandoraea sp. XJJ-1]|uniref:Uncharacterized protein n=1 Tax=Pandoraea cepalis TaxID=2508294 RepID=A0A5E4Y5Q1_9BURK|nr:MULTISPECIES: hypothetical protein [Pandoraea]MBN9117071.1 hypothetical protein [Pandoraea sp.]WAL82700.1 hypothetical protein OYT13_23615 [Pandoraea sp. XJJ-1]BDD92232.1 hypothetical protein PanNE5_16720 [Pandoraea sp. NE5]VVE43930.1 hypothetical protein PCE31106_04281 [Pandoraea cepalis]
MSDPLQHPTLTPPASVAPVQDAADDLLVQYERACADMQLAGRKLHRQMQDYHAVLDEVARLEAAGTPDAREKLKRLEALVRSEAFQRDEREIRRMTAALAHTLDRMRADAPVPLAAASTVPAKRAPAVRRVCA